ncbi:MAG: DNA-binding domain-containing protein [Legionellales bacterium]|nr:DNA-binding domain-containing protein [Legionellales bacterium]
MTKKFVNSSSDEALMFPVVGAHRLLAQAGHQKMLNDIKKNIAFNEDRYNILYEPLINNFVEYVQILSDIGKRSDEQLMNVGIERAFYITSQYLKDHGDKTDYAYIFALFSVALLLDVGRVDYRRNIMICNKNGIFIKEWQPLICGGIYAEGDFFKVRESINYSEKLANIITPLFAQKIVSDIGLLCLREQPDLLSSWLSTLARDDSVGGDFASDVKIYNKKFHDNRKKTLKDVLLDSLLIESLMAGEEFWKWLKKGLKDKTISINKKDSHVHKVASGLFIDYDGLAKEFSSIYSDKFPSWTVVVSQFNSLGVAKMSGHDYKFEQFFGNRGKHAAGSMFSGLGGNRMANSIKRPEGVVIEDVRGFIADTGHENSTHIKNSSSLDKDKALLSRADAVFGVNTNAGQHLDHNH